MQQHVLGFRDQQVFVGSCLYLLPKLLPYWFPNSILALCSPLFLYIPVPSQWPVLPITSHTKDQHESYTRSTLLLSNFTCGCLYISLLSVIGANRAEWPDQARLFVNMRIEFDWTLCFTSSPIVFVSLCAENVEDCWDLVGDIFKQWRLFFSRY